ncbi:MAG: type II toxin-antitoxin system VapB family antitoxin, partial [Actinobacteria bacterium]|nr:type II toxin-antitoxin system VapB family antitoxin [Actinomycetota bacterium]
AKMARTTVILDDQLLSEAKKITGERVTSKVVRMALQELVRGEKLKMFAKLEGSGIIDMTRENLERLRER